MIGHPPTDVQSSWGDIAKSAAMQMKRPARNVYNIEARGHICHELMYLLGGKIEFSATPMRDFVLKFLELYFPISPICRWTPPPNSVLEEIGFQCVQQARVYRLKPETGDTVVFFMNYRPEPPAAGSYLRSLFNVLQLDLSKFLRPPFRDELDHVLRHGMIETFHPISMTNDAKKYLATMDVEIRKAMWEEFCKD